MAQTSTSIVEIEKEFWAKSNDPEFFKRMFADDGITVVEPMGFVDKKSAVEMAKESHAWKDLQMMDVKTVEITPECKAVLYHGKAVREGTGEPYQASLVSVYVKRDGDWQLILSVHQPWDPEAKKSSA